MKNTLTTILVFTLFMPLWADIKYNAGVKIPAQKNTIYAKDFEKGRTHSEAIEKAMQVAKEDGQFTTVILDNHDWNIDRSVLIHSDLELVIDGCKIKMKDQTHDTLIRCENLIVDKNNPFGPCKSAGYTKNFRIIGKNGGALEGCDKPYKNLNHKGKLVPYYGDFFGWRGITILITEGENYEIANLKISKTKNWGISQEWCTHAYIHDLIYDVDVKNGDGINFRNGCETSVVENICGKTGHDTVACTALGNPNTKIKRNPKYMYPNQALGRGFDRKFRGIKNILIRNIFTVGKHHAVICLATTPIVENIEIENVCEPTQSQRASLVKIYTGYGDGYKKGNLRNIKVKNILSQGAKIAFELKADVENVQVEGVRQLNPNGKLTNFDKIPAGLTFKENL